ncbi:type II toxin-antitoxin system RelE family toxin [Paenibacillus rubinfantis]|uniref:type II toxin-antitoxin system RelE family toxin n=1 Tax=Paenibacillus rubinfantis TaxID=1720296 RepID=UPI0009E87DB7
MELSTDSEKYLRKLDKPTRVRILNHLKILTENPRHPELDIKKMQGRSNLYRLRIGSYRILYTIKQYLGYICSYDRTKRRCVQITLT